MYPKNNASPERVAIGQVILIADGTIQTSGVSIVVRGQAGAEGAGGGTTAYGADGTVYYTPTQAETNYTSFVIIAYKASCFSASQTIITTQSATAGQVRLEGVTHTSAVVPTVSTVTNAITLPTIPANWITATGVNAAALNGKGDWNIDKTGYSLTQTFPTNFSDLAIEVTTGKVNTKTADTVTDGAKSATALSVADWTATRAGYIDELASANIPQDLINIQGATFDTLTDSLEEIRNRGDAAWTTGAGGTPPDLLISTTIASLTSQTQFVLTAGSPDNDTYNGQIVIITDATTGNQLAVADGATYNGSTKEITLSVDPAIFTMAVGDTIDIIAATGAAGSGATAAQVWAYATRTLSANTNLNDLDAAGIRAAVGMAAADLDTQLTAKATVAALSNAQSDLDTLTGVDGATLASLQPNYAPNIVVPDAAGTAPTVTEITADIETNLTKLTTVLADTNELQLNQAAWATATGFATEAKQDAQDLIITELRLSELDAGTSGKMASEIDLIKTVVTNIEDGTIKKNTVGSTIIRMLDSSGTPIAAGVTVTGVRKLDTGAYAAMTAVISVTGSKGDSHIAWTAADVNGTNTVSFIFSATGALDVELTLQLT